MADCTDYPTPEDAKRFKNNAGSVDEFVTSDSDMFVDQDGGEHLTVTGIEQLAETQRDDIQQRSDIQYDDINIRAENQRNQFNATFQAQFTYVKIGNISDYVGDSLPESEKLNSYQYPDDSDNWYGPIQSQTFPITIPADPTVTGSGWTLVNGLTSSSLGGVTNYQAATVSDMIDGKPLTSPNVEHEVGQVWFVTGAYRVVSVSSPMTIDNFKALDVIYAADNGVVDDPDQLLDQTDVVQDFINSNQGRVIDFGDLNILVTKVRISGGCFINWNRCNIKGRVQHWVSTFSSCTAERATIQYYEIIGSQHSNYSNINGDVLYLQNNIPAFTGMYWLSFHNMHFKAMQVRQAAYADGTRSGFNVINFYDSTFKGGDLVNEFSIGPDTFGANVWFRDQDKEDSTGGVYPTYTEDGTDSSLTGSAKWTEILTQPFSFNGFDFSYSGNYTDPETVKSYGILNEGQPTVTVANGFIEGVEYSHENVKMDLTVECRPAGGKQGVPVNVTGQLTCSGSQRLATRFGNLLAGSMPIELNTEFKNALSSRYNIATGGSFESKSNLPFVSNSTSNRAIKLDNSDSSYARLEYTYTADESGVISVCVRGSDVGSITIKSGAGPTIFGLGYEFLDENRELYSVGTADVVAGEEVLITVVTKGGFSGETSDVAYITGFGVFKGRFATVLEQWQERSAISVPSSVVITDQNAWTTIATLTGTAYKSDSIKLEVSASQIGGSGGSVKCYWEGEIKFDSGTVLTLIERVNLVSIIGAGSTQVVIRLQEQASGVVEIQLQKGFFGQSLGKITIDSLEQVTEQLTLTVV